MGFFDELKEFAAPIGTAIGYSVGGPVGAAIGGGLGGAISTRKANQDAIRNAKNQTPQYNPIIQENLGDAIANVRDAPMATAFGGPRVAGLAPNQQTGIDMATALSQSLSGTQGGIRDAFAAFSDPNNMLSNPHLDSAINASQANARRDFNRTVMPSIRNTAIQTGGIGGSRQGIAEGVAIGDLESNLAAQELAARMGQYNTDADRVLQTLQSQGQILSGQTTPANLMLQTGALQQGQNQAQLTAEQQRFEEERELQNARNVEYLRLLMGAPASTPNLPATVNPAMAGIGTGLLVSQMFNPVGQNPATLPVPYSENWTRSPF